MLWGKRSRRERIPAPVVQMPAKYESPYLLGQELTKMGQEVAELTNAITEIANTVGAIDQTINQITNSQNTLIPYCEDMQKRLRMVEEWITEFVNSDAIFKERGIRDAQNVSQSIKRLGDVKV